jgi:hypothetical protein
VCPRRLLSLGREAAGERKYQKDLEAAVLKLLGYRSGTKLGIWPEAKLKYPEQIDGIIKQFDYTFDYILMPLERINLDDTSSLLGFNRVTGRQKATSREWLTNFLTQNGYAVTQDSNGSWVEEFPTADQA